MRRQLVLTGLILLGLGIAGPVPRVQAGAAVQGPAPQANGLRGEYFSDRSFDILGHTRIDPVIDFNDWGKKPPYAEGKLPNVWTDNLKQSWYVHFAVRWTGTVLPKDSGEHTFHVAADDGAMLWVGDQLVINGWKEGDNQFTGKIRLTAGQPARLKLLYFNSWFGGKIQLAWSTPLQPKHLIPASQLRPPEPEMATKPTPVGALAGQIETTAINLHLPLKYAPRGGAGIRHNVVLVPLKDGSYKLGWNDEQGYAHITTLNKDFKAQGRDIVPGKLDLRDLVAHDDGTMGVLAAELPLRMCLFRLGADGKVAFRTVLTGEKGQVLKERFLDDLWCFTSRLAWSGSEYAAHFAHVWQTEPKVAHQGGYFGAVDLSGQKKIDHGWTVSHSLDQRLLHHQGSFFTLSVGDAFPKGIHFENRTLTGGRVVYPPKERIEQFVPEWASLGSTASAGPNIALVFLVKEGKGRDMVYQLLDEEGLLLKTTKLGTVPATGRPVVRMAPFGKNLLLAWQEKEGMTRVAVIDYYGRFLNDPVVVAQSLPENDELVIFPGGDVGWVEPRDGQEQLKLVRVRLTK